MFDFGFFWSMFLINFGRSWEPDFVCERCNEAFDSRWFGVSRIEHDGRYGSYHHHNCKTHREFESRKEALRLIFVAKCEKPRTKCPLVSPFSEEDWDL